MRKESQLRSAIKSLTWRCIAISDTFLVVLIVTCYFDQCSVAHALTIGFVEFVFKAIVYYVHERIWQRIQFKNRKATVRTLVKAFSWRGIATLMTFMIAGAVIDNASEIAMYIAIIEIFTKTILYYVHERLWLILPLGRVRKFAKRVLNAR
jgi:uncharacterized membrane protein